MAHYDEKEKDNIDGIKNIEKTIELSRNKDEVGLKTAIRKYFTTYMKDFVKELSLHLLLNFIVEVCG